MTQPRSDTLLRVTSVPSLRSSRTFATFVFALGLASGCGRRHDPAPATGDSKTPTVVVTAPSTSPSPGATASVVDAPSSTPSAESPDDAWRAPTDAGLDTSDDVEGTIAWVKERVRRAATSAELVRMPVTRHGPGWGCICPETYVGTSPVTGGAFVDVTWADTARPANVAETLVVEGYFDATTHPFVAPKGTTEEYDHVTLHRFRALRSRPTTRDANGGGDAPSESDRRAVVMLDGKDAHRERTTPEVGSPWVLVAESIPIADASGRVRAEALVTKLRSKGFEGAAIVDSRTTPGLFCCHWVVVTGTFGTEAAARDASVRAKKDQGVNTIVRRAF
ncbi:MAG: hypothetical protein U0169_10655 [Polyangiaceae bacterium]